MDTSNSILEGWSKDDIDFGFRGLLGAVMNRRTMNAITNAGRAATRCPQDNHRKADPRRGGWLDEYTAYKRSVAHLPTEQRLCKLGFCETIAARDGVTAEDAVREIDNEYRYRQSKKGSKA